MRLLPLLMMAVCGATATGCMDLPTAPVPPSEFGGTTVRHIPAQGPGFRGTVGLAELIVIQFGWLVRTETGYKGRIQRRLG